ncbi:MAG: helix-turn-helix domain-containing protein [Clostridia bacterium]|nr:helix-turn-helix domain-containing protein [Clostridia bacterium]
MYPLRYHESRKRGSADFPLEYHDLDHTHPRYQMPWHWHSECEMIHVRTGSFMLTVDETSIALSPGDIAFIGPEHLHGGIPKDCTYECIVFDMRMLLQCNDACRALVRKVLHAETAVPFLSPAGSPAASSVLPLFSALREKSPGYELTTIGCLFRFLGLCYESPAPPSAPLPLSGSQRLLQLRQVFEMMETDYASPLTLDALARAAHMSPKYFCRFFKETTHRTPIDYLNFYRIEMACNEISSTEKTLTEIALDSGFTNLNYFIRQFRKYKEETPGAYLKRMRPKV